MHSRLGCQVTHCAVIYRVEWFWWSCSLSWLCKPRLDQLLLRWFNGTTQDDPATWNIHTSEYSCTTNVWRKNRCRCKHKEQEWVKVAAVSFKIRRIICFHLSCGEADLKINTHALASWRVSPLKAGLHTISWWAKFPYLMSLKLFFSGVSTGER